MRECIIVKNKVNKKGGRPRKYTNAELIRQLKALARRIGKRPTDRDINAACKEGRCASAITFAAAFGSMREAYRRAGLGNAPGHPYPKEEVRRALMRLIDEVGDLPTYRQIDMASREGRCPSSKTITAHFGLLGRLRHGHSRLDP